VKNKLAAVVFTQQRRAPAAVGWAARIRKPELLKTASHPAESKRRTGYVLEIVQTQYSWGFASYATRRLPEAGFVSLFGGLRCGRSRAGTQRDT